MGALARSTTGAKRRRHTLGSVAGAVLAAVATAWLLALGLLYVGGYRPLVVASGSMAPAVASGDLIITQPVAPIGVAVGDVVSFRDNSRGGRLVTHRVTALHREGRRIDFVTRGDVNGGVERWSSAADARVSKLALRVPLAGYAITSLTRLPIILALLAIVVLAFAYAVSAARGTRRVARAALTALTSAAAIVSVPIMLGATEGAFSATAANTGNDFQAAASFCPVAPQTVSAVADTYISEENPTVNYGGDGTLKIKSQPNENNRMLVRFALPAAPSDPHCTTMSAVLELNRFWGVGDRTLNATRVTTVWDESTATWNFPAVISTAGASATAQTTADPVAFSVTAQVTAMYAGPNRGFLIRDSVENSIGLFSDWWSREVGMGPTLTITYT